LGSNRGWSLLVVDSEDIENQEILAALKVERGTTLNGFFILFPLLCLQGVPRYYDSAAAEQQCHQRCLQVAGHQDAHQ
jgi:hypothetical protein